MMTKEKIERINILARKAFTVSMADAAAATFAPTV